MPKRVSLCGIEDFLLIVEHPSGVHYDTQSGGAHCAHPSQEGILIPLSSSIRTFRSARPLEDQWFSWGVNTDTDDQQEFNDDVEHLLVQFFPDLVFDHERAKSMSYGEAWLPVKIKGCEEMGTLRDFVGCRAILTYPNSD